MGKRVLKVQVTISGEDGVIPRTTATFEVREREWKVDEPAFPRHLRMLVEIAEAVRKADG